MQRARRKRIEEKAVEFLRNNGINGILMGRYEAAAALREREARATGRGEAAKVEAALSEMRHLVGDWTGLFDSGSAIIFGKRHVSLAFVQDDGI